MNVVSSRRRTPQLSCAFERRRQRWLQNRLCSARISPWLKPVPDMSAGCGDSCWQAADEWCRLLYDAQFNEVSRGLEALVMFVPHML